MPVVFFFLCLYALAQIRSLAVMWFRLRSRTLPKPMAGTVAEWPQVAVQLPVYREQKVMDQLLSSVLGMDYPIDRLHIQVIDDSEKPEASLTRAVVERYQHLGVRVEYLHRDRRTGYKAGALNHGLHSVSADFVAVFDADFQPSRDFLKRLVPYFRNEKVSAVQARWSHTNDLHSPLTMAQAAVFDKLFAVENSLRSRFGLSAMFLGTGGMWRRKALEDTGGWREIPFTAEDLDLSYRAQIAGWTVAYEEDPLSSCELPDTYLAYKSQQRRWARGCFQTFLHHWKNVLSSTNAGASLLEGSALMPQIGMQAMVVLTLVASLHVLFGLPRSASWIASQVLFTATIVCSPALLELILAQKLLHPDWVRRSALLLRALPFLMGLTITLLAGFYDTLFRGDKEFVRTPKQKDEPVLQGSSRRWFRDAVPVALLELSFAVAAAAALVLAILNCYTESIVPLSLQATGFAISASASWTEIWRSRGGTR